MTLNFYKKLITIIGLLSSINTFAYNFEVDGLYYNVISIPELTCEVTYKDTNYNSYKGEISIPEIVTYQNREIKVISIGNNAFNACNKVTSISIPNSVTKIGSLAFSGCTGLTSITIPNSVTTISDYAFDGCTGLTGNFIIPNLMTEIGGGMFRGCSGLTSVTIPNSVTSITGGAFEYCSGLTEVTIPNSVTEIGDDAFRGCSSLTSVTIPNSITSIGNRAFDGCTGLTELIIDDGPERLSLGYDSNYSYGEGKAQFYDCPLEKLYLGRNLSYTDERTYGYSPFYNKSTLKTITISGSVTNINPYAFYGCTGLTSITIPNSVTSIGNYAFMDCTNLAEVIIEDGEKTLSLGYRFWDSSGYNGSGLFYDCPLEKLYLGRNLDYKTIRSAGFSPFYREYRTIESMVISNSVTELHDNILFVNIKHLTFLDGKTEISLGSQPSSCSLDSLYLGRNLSAEYDYSPSNLSHLTIGENANNITPLNLKNCTQLYAIESKNLTPPTIGEFSNASYISASVIIPHGSINSYLAADVWKNFWNISEAGIESTICDDDISLTIKNDNIIINNIDSPQVEVYNINGQIVYKGNSTIIPVSTNGLYIVKINNNSYKVVL